MVLIAIEVLDIVEGMVIMIPVTNDDTRISLSVEVLEGVKSWSNLAGNDPLETMNSGDLRNWSEMKMGVVDQASFWIWCSLMKPDQFAAIIGYW